MYNIPFTNQMQLIELGGGDKPIIRPNVDVRPGPTVDLVADLNKPLPIPSDAYDGLYCCYAIEHISWRTVKTFIAETARILRPHGLGVFITANLLEQARQLLVENPDWKESDICGIFGDQDYPENSHKCGFSPTYAIKLFKEAGYQKVITLPHPACATDLIIEAYKSN